MPELADQIDAGLVVQNFHLYACLAQPVQCSLVVMRFSHQKASYAGYLSRSCTHGAWGLGGDQQHVLVGTEGLLKVLLKAIGFGVGKVVLVLELAVVGLSDNVTVDNQNRSERHAALGDGQSSLIQGQLQIVMFHGVLVMRDSVGKRMTG